MRTFLLTIVLVAAGCSVIVSCTSGTSSREPDPRIEEETAPKVTPEPGYSSSGPVRETAESTDPAPEKEESTTEPEETEKNPENNPVSKRTESTEKDRNGDQRELEEGSGKEKDTDQPLLLRALAGTYSHLPVRFRQERPGTWIRYRIEATADNSVSPGFVTYSYVGKDGEYRWIEKTYQYRNRENIFRYLVDKRGRILQAYQAEEDRKNPSVTSILKRQNPIIPGNVTIGDKRGNRQFRNGHIRVFKGTLELNGEGREQELSVLVSGDLPVVLPDTSNGLVRLTLGNYRIVLEDFGSQARKKISLPY